MSAWYQLYQLFLEFFLNIMGRIWDISVEHFWILFPLIVSFVCGLISLTLYFLFRVLKSNV